MLPERRAGTYRNGEQAGCADVCLRSGRTVVPRTDNRSSGVTTTNLLRTEHCLSRWWIARTRKSRYRFGRSGFTAIMFPLPPDMANSPNMP